MASGDIIYKGAETRQNISAAQAKVYADQAIVDGLWAGDRADMLALTVFRKADGTFGATVRGLVTAAAADVPVGAEHVGVVP